MYPWLVYLHIIAIFGFLLAHGASVAASFALKQERNLERVRVLLMLSVSTYGIMYLALLVLLLSGVGAGFAGNWWGSGWIWTSLVLLIVIILAMGAMGSRIYGGARRAAGLPYMEGTKLHAPVEPSSPEELDRILSRGNPILLTAIGYGGFAIVAWLMIFKPF